MGGENFIKFWFKYQYNNLVTRLQRNKKETYLLLLLGKYPPNIMEFIKVTLASGGDFRYSLGINTIVILLESTKTINEIDICAKSRFDGYLDHYVVFKRSEVADDNYLFSMNKMLYSNLYMLPSDKTITQRLIEMDSTISLLIKSTDQYNQFIDDVNEEVRKGIWDMIDEDDEFDQPINISPQINQKDELNRILEKVAELGYDNITAEEKLTLSKFK